MIRRNRVDLIGRATRDVELKEAGNSKVCTIRLAVNERISRKDGGKPKEKTVYIDCECWGQKAEFAAAYAKKGSIVSVEGKLEQDEWGEGENRRQKHKIYVLELQIDNFRRDGDGQPQTANAGATAGAAADGDANLPF